MNKPIKWLVPALVLAWLGMAGCSSASEAKITVTNRSTKELKVSVNSLSTTLAVGAADTITMTWPGRNSLDVTVIYYPTGQASQARYQYLELNRGDALSVNLEFDD